jgi:AcrR family transcriptional regulator
MLWLSNQSTMPTQEPEPRKDTRERLIESARLLFLRQGYGARSGSLYHFFSTREDLLLAVLERYQELLCPAVIQPVLERISDPIERIFGVLDGYRRMLLESDYQWGCPIGNLALEIGQSHPAARRLIGENFTAWRAYVQQWVEDASGRLPESADSQQLALFVLTTMEGAVMLARSYHSIEPYDTAVSQLRDYFDRLLADGSEWLTPRPAG